MGGQEPALYTKSGKQPSRRFKQEDKVVTRAFESDHPSSCICVFQEDTFGDLEHDMQGEGLD